MPLNFGGNVVDGKKYDLELANISIRRKVVAFKEALRGVPGTIGVEYDKLTEDKKKIVDAAPDDFFDLRPGETEKRAKPRYKNTISFQFKEVDSGKNLFLSFDMQMNGFPEQRLREFVTQSTGFPIVGDEGFKWGNLYKKGDVFVGTVIRTDKGRLTLDPTTVVKKSISTPVVTGPVTISDNAQIMLDFIKRELVHQSKGVIVDYFQSGLNGLIGPVGEDPESSGQRRANTYKAWTELKSSGIEYSKDGKTFSF